MIGKAVNAKNHLKHMNMASFAMNNEHEQTN